MFLVNKKLCIRNSYESMNKWQWQKLITALITLRLWYSEPGQVEIGWLADWKQTFWLSRAENGTNWSRAYIKRHQRGRGTETAWDRSGTSRWSGGTCRAGAGIHYGWMETMNVGVLAWKSCAMDPSIHRHEPTTLSNPVQRPQPALVTTQDSRL